jgi:hypothetical protein
MNTEQTKVTSTTAFAREARPTIFEGRYATGRETGSAAMTLAQFNERFPLSVPQPQTLQLAA